MQESGKIIRSTRLWLNVALVPERDVFQRGDGVAAQHAREAGEALPGDGIALVRHGAAEPFWPSVNGFLGFQNFRALQMTELHRPAFNARADQRERVHEFGVEVALHDLRGDGRRAQAEFFADEFFDDRRQMRVRADRAGKFADGDHFAGAFEAFQRAGKFIVHQRHLQTERGRFAVDAVAAADARREFDAPSRAGR